MTAQLLHGDALDVLATLPAGSVQACITSPPYFGLRDYGVEGQIGLEETPEEYVERLVAVFRGVRRVLRDDGTLWLNLGDSYAVGGMSNPSDKSTLGGGKDRGAASYSISRHVPAGLKPKDLIGVPWRVAFALQADGWYLRADIIWHKPNPMPESVRDRPTKAHEYLFLLSKSERYFYDADAIAEPSTGVSGGGWSRAYAENQPAHGAMRLERPEDTGKRNKRSVWTVATRPYPEAHFATYPPDLIRPCVLAATRPGDTVLDPFNGSGTTGQVALEHGRDYIGIDLNTEYLELARRRLAPLLAQPRLLEAV